MATDDRDWLKHDLIHIENGRARAVRQGGPVPVPADWRERMADQRQK